MDPRPGASFFVVGISLEVTLDKGRFVCAAAFKAGAGRKPPQALDIRSAYSWPRTLRIRLRRVPHGACLIIIKSANDGIETSASRESAGDRPSVLRLSARQLPAPGPRPGDVLLRASSKRQPWIPIRSGREGLTERTRVRTARGATRTAPRRAPGGAGCRRCPSQRAGGGRSLTATATWPGGPGGSARSLPRRRSVPGAQRRLLPSSVPEEAASVMPLLLGASGKR